MKWFKFKVALAAAVVSMFISGCGTDSPQACAYKVQQNLDGGEYVAVIAELNNSSSVCYQAGGFTKEAGYENLGAAYVGAAGFDVSGLIKLFSEINIEDAISLSSSGDFNRSNPDQVKKGVALVSTLSKHLGANGSAYLDKAGATYASIVSTAGVNCGATFDAKYTVACKLKDLNGTGEKLGNLVKQANSASAVTTSLGDDLGAFLSFTSKVEANSTTPDRTNVNDNNSSDDGEVLKCAFTDSNKTDGNCSEPTITYNNDHNATFRTVNGNDNNFTYLVKIFDVNDTNNDDNGSATYIKLIGFDGFVYSPATTKDYCDINFTSCKDVNMSTSPKCYPCPVVNDANNTISSTSDGLLSVVNGDDTTFIEAFLPADINLTAYETNATDSNSTPLVAYIRDQSDSNATGPLTSEEIALLLELFNGGN
ncbi:MAG: hypothetical protein KU28_00215 [Sulfurovum sp. PC08-66]|nr:MAG: hypothetical protein KU28_00215 [Sulfurovum sp. PC08-66]KIM12395.1 MAG: hypothetical protein KU37_00335 [Sulfuricurvum sp. PC08-66]